MRGPALHTADEASRRELAGASVRLLLSLLALGLLLVPLVRELPLGRTSRTGLLAWLLVGLGVYWLYAGLGYRALLLVQLGMFSAAATLLSVKALFVGAGVRQFGLLREAARVLLILGGICALANLGAMVIALLARRSPAEPPG